MRDMALSKALRSLRSGKEQDEGQGGGKRAPVAEITSQVSVSDVLFDILSGCWWVKKNVYYSAFPGGRSRSRFCTERSLSGLRL